MHARHATLGNANALHLASRHTARLERATVLCMQSKHAALGNANALHRARQALSTAHGSHSACTPGVQHLAMQMHYTVPAGTQHGSREPPCCACTQSMLNLAMQCIAHRARQALSTVQRCHSAVHAHQACNTWQCKCIAPCRHSHSTARESHSAVHVFKACKTWQCNALHRARQAYSTAQGSAVHAHQACNTWQCECTAPCQQAHSTARESHSAVHALKACKTWQCNALHRDHQAHSMAQGSHSAVHACQAGWQTMYPAYTVW